jgi:hypothetical protein
MQFRNPSNNYVETAATPALTWVMTFLLGPIYLAYKGCWGHAAFYVLLCLFVVTAPFVWFFYPFFSYTAINNHYRRMGWIAV